MKSSKITGFAVALLLLASGALLAVDVPLNNWTVPPYTQGRPGAGSPPWRRQLRAPFIGIQPCRVADTRGNGAPIQGGIFGNSSPADLGPHRDLRHSRRHRGHLGELHRRVRPGNPGRLVPALLADRSGSPADRDHDLRAEPDPLQRGDRAARGGRADRGQRQRKHAHHHGRQRLLRSAVLRSRYPFPVVKRATAGRSARG